MLDKFEPLPRTVSLTRADLSELIRTCVIAGAMMEQDPTRGDLLRDQLRTILDNLFGE